MRGEIRGLGASCTEEKKQVDTTQETMFAHIPGFPLKSSLFPSPLHIHPLSLPERHILKKCHPSVEDLQGLTDEDTDRMNLELNPQPRELEVTRKSSCIGHSHRR